MTTNTNNNDTVNGLQDMWPRHATWRFFSSRSLDINVQYFDSLTTVLMHLPLCWLRDLDFFYFLIMRVFTMWYLVSAALPLGLKMPAWPLTSLCQLWRILCLDFMRPCGRLITRWYRKLHVLWTTCAVNLNFVICHFIPELQARDLDLWHLTSKLIRQLHVT